MLDKIKNTIEKYNMLKMNDKVVVGVSGGPDSVCLFHVLMQLKENLKLQVFIAHINHCLRGKEADDDEKYVLELADKYNVKCFVKKEDVHKLAEQNKLTVEEAGRKLRYDFFYEVMEKVNAEKIAVGHNTNDRAETVLFNLIRGTGLEGLKGIEPVRDNIIRPLIELSREEIEKYCKDNNLETHIDKTNLENLYMRNRIRNELIPYIKKDFNSNIVETLNRMANILDMENKYLDEIVKFCLEKCVIEENDNTIILNINEFNCLDSAIKARVIRSIVERLNGSAKDIEKNHIDKVINLAILKKTNKGLQLPGQLYIRIEYDNLIFSKIAKQINENYSYKLNVGITNLPICDAKFLMFINEIGNISEKDKYICVLDYEKITNNIDKLTVRNRRDGDVFSPKGMKGTKKLKDYFIDKKVPVSKRNEMPLLALGNEIVWVIGDRISEKYIANGKGIICKYYKNITS